MGQVDMDHATEIETSAQAVTELPVQGGRYFNRYASWLQFNRRVLAEASRTRHPLLERAKFLAIFSTNLDEFFMVHVADLLDLRDIHPDQRSPDGMSIEEQLGHIKTTVVELAEEQHRCWQEELQPQLREQGIHVVDYAELDKAQRAAVRRRFDEEIFPVLTPLAFDPGRPFPHISNLSLNLAVVINDPQTGERFARIKVPGVFPRLLPVPSEDGSTVLVWLEQVIAAHMQSLFPGLAVAATYPFKVTRDGGVELKELESDDLLETIEREVRQRHWGDVVRLTVDESMPERIRMILIENLEIDGGDVYQVRGSLGLAALMELYKLPRPDLKDPPLVPAVPPAFAHADPFSAIRQGDILLHHPFESFQPVVDLLRVAADDPNVLAIKQTLYRIGKDKPIVDALMRAREHGKQVSVLVELKARFDEENNIEWAKQLENAGVHVVYGLLGLKTHCKVALIVRREADGMRRYVHLSTGNYNVATTRIYTDLGLLTCDQDMGADASDLFNLLTGYSRLQNYRAFAVAPVNLRSRIVELIDREIAHHRKGGGGRLIFKMNGLYDVDMVEALYRASMAGVEIDLLVRGICSLRPGVPGMSPTIKVRSIIGRFLEHTRIYSFGNGGQEEIYLASADLMTRNLDRRVETMFPVREPSLRQRIRDEILHAYLEDTENAHLLEPDGTYTPADTSGGSFDSQQHLLQAAMSRT
jgi:polyphosphate kinase